MNPKSYFKITISKFKKSYWDGPYNQVIDYDNIDYYIEAENISDAYNKFIEKYPNERVIKMEKVYLRIL